MTELLELVLVLLQEDAHGIDHPVCYFLRKFLKPQLNYSTTEKEALALLLLQYFEVYVASSSGLHHSSYIGTLFPLRGNKGFTSNLDVPFHRNSTLGHNTIGIIYHHSMQTTDIPLSRTCRSQTVDGALMPRDSNDNRKNQREQYNISLNITDPPSLCRKETSKTASQSEVQLPLS